MNTKRVIIGMSGGVDSAVSAQILKERGYEVIGLFMNNWEEQDGGVCSSADDWRDVQSVCAKIGIKSYSVNFSEDYLNDVFSYFLKEYRAFRTPNPDVACNREIKFGVFRDYALNVLEGDYVATGHYAALDGNNLMCAADENKDQTYFLNQVKTEQLNNVIFPLAEVQKSEVRDLAEKYALSVAKKKDSTGICFIGERRFKQFLKTYLPANKGEIVDLKGNVVGTHDGIMFYTLGQRRGLDIGGVKNTVGRWFVVGKDVSTNRLIVSCGDQSPLMSSTLRGEELNIIGEFDLKDGIRISAKTRYRQTAQAATYYNEPNGFRLEFDEPQRAITPGQYAVLYLGKRCLGGGVITSSK